MKFESSQPVISGATPAFTCIENGVGKKILPAASDRRFDHRNAREIRRRLSKNKT
jgi:hypothetical protein